MSTRYLKKAFGNDVALPDQEELEQEIENIHIEKGKHKGFNVFSLLNDQSEHESTEERETRDEEDEEEICVTKTKSKKKRKKHKVQKQRNRQDVKATSEDERGDNQDSSDEIERVVKQVNRLLGEPTLNNPGSSNSSQSFVFKNSKEKILTVQHKHLNPYNELKKIFGSKTIQAEQVKLKNRNRIGHTRKTWLVTAQESMLPYTKSGISMAIDKSMSMNNVENVQYFVYEHSLSYRQIQKKFIQSVESLNPENIISIVNTHPYHIDALLQSAELCKLNEELAMAAKLIERALYYLEAAFHPLFDSTSARCRLDYKKQTNRALFITLFKHLVLVGGRACYRTSLELCKFLLSLDPEEDPLAVVLMIDFYALRSKEYEWFCEFCDLWENARNLQQLPNIAYSLALAHFHLGKQEEADKYLQNALIMFPGILVPLLDKCNIMADSKVTGHDFFMSTATSTTSPALEKLQTLFIARNHHLWKEPEILPWLEKQVHIVIQRVGEKDEFIKFCQMKRKQRYQGKLPRNILRHLLVSDLKDVTVNVQEIQSEGSILSHDPLPPENSIDIYTNPRTTRRTNPTNSNFFSLFFSSIFPDIEAAVGMLNGAEREEEDRINNEYD